MLVVCRLIVSFVVCACLVACSEPPACERLVERLCAAAGEEGCELLKANGPTDAASCQATLDDARVLNAQLDALVAALAARGLVPAKTPPPATKK